MDEIVSVVFFLSCKVIQICRVLVLQREETERSKVKATQLISCSVLCSTILHHGVDASCDCRQKHWYLDALQPPPSLLHFLSEPILLCLGTSAGLAPEWDQTCTHKMCISLCVNGLTVTHVVLTSAVQLTEFLHCSSLL